MQAYDDYFAGKLEDYEYPVEKVKESLAHLPKVAV
jgi:tryptophan synthase beta chain